MEVLLFIVVLFLSFLVGIFGFCQIVGSLKFFKPQFLFTIILWIIILSIGFIIVLNFLSNYIIALIIGYAISLFFSFSTKPEEDDTPPQNFDLSLLSEEDKSNYEALENIIHTIADKLIVTAPSYDYCDFERIEQNYSNGKITHEEYIDKINALKEYNALEEMFFTYKNQRNEIVKKYNMKI